MARLPLEATVYATAKLHTSIVELFTPLASRLNFSNTLSQQTSSSRSAKTAASRKDSSTETWDNDEGEDADWEGSVTKRRAARRRMETMKMATGKFDIPTERSRLAFRRTLANAQKIGLDRSPFFPKTAAEYVGAKAGMLEDKAALLKVKLAEKEARLAAARNAKWEVIPVVGEGGVLGERAVPVYFGRGATVNDDITEGLASNASTVSETTPADTNGCFASAANRNGRDDDHTSVESPSIAEVLPTRASKGNGKGTEDAAHEAHQGAARISGRVFSPGEDTPGCNGRGNGKCLEGVKWGFEDVKAESDSSFTPSVHRVKPKGGKDKDNCGEAADTTTFPGTGFVAWGTDDAGDEDEEDDEEYDEEDDEEHEEA
ncbi:hypothetical protein N0V88_000341 [Collariella sp. IMI 366227]|nr:hypothetical protein N0V88_000341 [Collariella sp. IMI 366227]